MNGKRDRRSDDVRYSGFQTLKKESLPEEKLYEKSGIDFQLGYEIKSAQEFLGIVDTHDAVLLAIGAENPIHLNVSGANSNFVFQALEYLHGDRNRLPWPTTNM